MNYWWVWEDVILPFPAYHLAWYTCSVIWGGGGGEGGWDGVSKGLTSYYIHKWIQPARNIRFPRLPASSLTAPGGTGEGEGRVIGTRAPQRAFSQSKDSLIFHDKNNESHKREIASFNYSCNFYFSSGRSRQVQNLRDELYQSKLRLEKETSSLKEANKVRFEFSKFLSGAMYEENKLNTRIVATIQELYLVVQ